MNSNLSKSKSIENKITNIIKKNTKKNNRGFFDIIKSFFNIKPKKLRNDNLQKIYVPNSKKKKVLVLGFENFLFKYKIKNKKNKKSTIVLNKNSINLDDIVLKKISDKSKIKIKLDGYDFYLKVYIKEDMKDFLKKIKNHFEVVLWSMFEKKIANSILKKLNLKQYIHSLLDITNCLLIDDIYYKSIKVFDIPLNNVVYIDNCISTTWEDNLKNSIMYNPFKLETYYSLEELTYFYKNKNNIFKVKTSFILIENFLVNFFIKNKIQFPLNLSFNIFLQKIDCPVF